MVDVALAWLIANDKEKGGEYPYLTESDEKEIQRMELNILDKLEI